MFHIHDKKNVLEKGWRVVKGFVMSNPVYCNSHVIGWNCPRVIHSPIRSQKSFSANDKNSTRKTNN